MDDFVSVFETGEPGLVALAKSLLDSAGIDFTTKGEALQDVLGLGRFPGGANLLAGPVVFQVRPDDAKEASTLLLDLETRKRQE